MRPMAPKAFFRPAQRRSRSVAVWATRTLLALWAWAMASMAAACSSSPSFSPSTSTRRTAAASSGYPEDAAAVLLVEVDGLKEGLEEQAAAIEAIAQAHRARSVRVAQTATERDLLWAGRKNAFGAMGRISPEYYVVDGVVPRTKLPGVLAAIGEVGDRHGLRIANVFHAGDGNLHPLILF